MPISILFYFILLYLRILHVYGWGPVGRRLVACLAQSQLSVTTNSWILEYLPEDLVDNLSAIASWPDTIL